ncbi:MAG TPA: hypothetical protein DEB18_14475 [Leeuwenhoekiella sp.]|nr:hypothetical protein [Leeuwenhoekiella sp.]
MLEIMAAVSVCNSALNGFQKLCARGAELEQCVGHLSRWFEAASDLSARQKEQENPPFYKKITAQGSIEAEALNITIAKKKMQEQETQLRELLIYRFGPDTYREMMQLRKDIRARREKQVYATRRRQKILMECLVGGTILGLGIGIIALCVSFIL